ncbi:MAG: hypothetical protein A2Y25_05185 [Candidatus Melainabacteria bacterium GWF2_37_15]|nr:MAG: hypothetical protein A2Y25_05185 [Candidatus Melainabacteria bacterium GWF2_37_15]
MLNSISSSIYRAASIRNPTFSENSLTIPDGKVCNIDAVADEVFIHGTAQKNVYAQKAINYEGGEVLGHMVAEETAHNFGDIKNDMASPYSENRWRVKGNIYAKTAIISGEVRGDVDAQDVDIREANHRMGIKGSRVGGNIIVDNTNGKGKVRISDPYLEIGGKFIFKGKKGVVECPKNMANSLQSKIENGTTKAINYNIDKLI